MCFLVRGLKHAGPCGDKVAHSYHHGRWPRVTAHAQQVHLPDGLFSVCPQTGGLQGLPIGFFCTGVVSPATPDSVFGMYINQWQVQSSVWFRVAGAGVKHT